METRLAEIADGVYRLSTFVPEVAPPGGLTFNQFLILGDEPLLFHTGPRRMFPLVREAVARLVAPERLRWITFGHFEADECGSMNEWLATAPDAQVAHGRLGCDLSLNDMADRTPRALDDREVIELGGGKRVRYLETPHTPMHIGSVGIYDPSTASGSYQTNSPVILGGDLFTQQGDPQALVETDILGPAIAAEDLFGYSALNPDMGRTLRRLADLAPRTLALMHGPAYAGDGAAALLALADDYDRRSAMRCA